MRRRPGPSALLGLVSGVALAACAARRPCPAPTIEPAGPRGSPLATTTLAARPAFDRERERRAVLRAVLVGVYREPTTRRFVVDRALSAAGPMGSLDDREIERLRAAGLQVGDPLRLADGSRMFRPSLDGVSPAVLDDWAAHAAPSRTPTNLDAPLPIDWVEASEWADLAVRVGDDRVDIDATWEAFHRRHPSSLGWVHLADVGFSAAGDVALTYAWSLRGGLDGGGAWYVLEKRGGVWTIVKKEQDWVS